MGNPLPSLSPSQLHDLAMLYLSPETAFKVLNFKAPKTPAIQEALAQLNQALLDSKS